MITGQPGCSQPSLRLACGQRQGRCRQDCFRITRAQNVALLKTNCPALTRLDDPHVTCSQHLVRRARQCNEDPIGAKCYWLRGLVPKEWTHQPDPTSFSVSSIGEWEIGQSVQSKYIYLDGSGGAHSRDKRLRRCGWAWVSTDVQVCHCGRMGSLMGCQTAPRAEAFA